MFAEIRDYAIKDNGFKVILPNSNLGSEKYSVSSNEARYKCKSKIIDLKYNKIIFLPTDGFLDSLDGKKRTLKSMADLKEKNG
jgi:hypothetical protein